MVPGDVNITRITQTCAIKVEFFIVLIHSGLLNHWGCGFYKICSWTKIGGFLQKSQKTYYSRCYSAKMSILCWKNTQWTKTPATAFVSFYHGFKICICPTWIQKKRAIFPKDTINTPWSKQCNIEIAANTMFELEATWKQGNKFH